MYRQRIENMLVLLLMIYFSDYACAEKPKPNGFHLNWSRLPELPDALGVAGPFVGVHNNVLIVAGGANFPKPVWESNKVWRDRLYVLSKQGDSYRWHNAGKLKNPLAYGAAVSTPNGIVCMGGNDADTTFKDVFLLAWNAERNIVERTSFPALPKPCAYGQACLIGDSIYFSGGQSGSGLETAMNNLWCLDLSNEGDPLQFQWRELSPCPGKPRAFNLTISQQNGAEQCVYIMSGRTRGETGIEFLKDVWEYNPNTSQWRRRADLPQCVMAGTGIGFGKSSILVLGGADGSLFTKSDELKDDHPGFPKRTYVFDTINNQWSTAGPSPQNHVTTIPVLWNDRIIIVSGEIRPRVRSSNVWSIAPSEHSTK